MEKEKSHEHATNSRPRLHFTTSTWINDPCAPGYDPKTGEYHLFYQCNPFDCEWGNMSWGHITSKDLVTWTRRTEKPALNPDQEYDKEGVFTGCFAPLTGAKEEQLTLVYSSICHMPFHWRTPPYPRNAAGLALATSNDGGETWVKPSSNPILEGEPEGIAVTGFRDPFLARWPEADRLLERTEERLYGLVSGGVDSSGPTTFLYDVEPNDLSKWKYLGPLVEIKQRFQPSEKWSGNYGINWECTNFFTFEPAANSRQFLLIGAEGDVEREHVKNFKSPAGVSRTVRTQVWMSGDLVRKEDSIKFEYRYGGFVDHGSYYAGNTFLDPKSGRRILYGWIPEEDIPLDHARLKGWNGSLALPREVFIITIPNVIRALHSPLAEIACIDTELQQDGLTKLETLGVKPISELNRWRDNCLQFRPKTSSLSLPTSDNKQSATIFSAEYSAWELEAIISLDQECESVGFHIRHNDDLSTRTTIAFSTLNEAITVTRESSSPKADIIKCPESGPFTLFTTRPPGDDQQEEQEKLHLRVFSDGDVLEIFANDRFALATMVYSDIYDATHGGITAFATGGKGSGVFESIKLWDGLNWMKSIVVD